MPRKTRFQHRAKPQVSIASMRPRPDAAENPNRARLALRTDEVLQ